MKYEKVCRNCHRSFPAGETVCPFCGSECPNGNPGGALPDGTLLGDKYVIGKTLEVDSEGVIYEAADAATSLPVLIKEYLPVVLCSNRSPEGDVVVRPGSEVLYKTTMVDFDDLYKTLMKLSGRPGLCRVIALFRANNTVYAVMEWPKSITLTEWLNRQTELLSFERCMSLLTPVFSGLSAMHAAGVIHRGICPDNIRITSDGKAFLTGFATLSMRSVNTDLKAQLYEGYSAPEQYSATEFQGPYTDVFSLAAVLYKMLAGTAPVSSAEKGEECPSLRQLGTDVTVQVSRAVSHAMAADTAQRTQTIDAFQAELLGREPGMGSTRVMNRVGGAGAASTGLNLKRLLILIGCAAAVCALIIILVWNAIKGKVPVSGSSSSSVSSVSVSSSSVSSSSSKSSSAKSSSAVTKVPNFVGMLYSDIQANSEYSAFVFNVTEEYSDNIDEGKVISQSPTYGKELPSDMKIELAVSKGKKMITVPDYIGYTRDEALTILTSAGLNSNNINFVTKKNDGTMDPGKSVGGTIQPGSTMDANGTIVIYIAGDLPTPTPTPTPAPASSSAPESTSTSTSVPDSSTSASSGTG